MAELKLERREDQGRLRIYIGAAPGVGKTYTMINDACNMKHQQGIDVVIGLVEPHGRQETAARIRDLEIVPQHVIPYRGVELKEMDVDAIIARHPHTVVVDELAHTNVPGSKNRKRYEDVLEILEAGINVLTAVNIQHLETLNDAVNRSANTVIRETVPDNFFKRADEVVNVDVTVNELRNRLRQGKIYAPEKVEQSLANFFRIGNLNLLRELSLRTTAEQVSTRESEFRRAQGLEQAATPEKVMVCLSTRPGTERLIRVGSRIAGRLAIQLVRRLRHPSRRRQGPRRPRSPPAPGRVSAHGPRSRRQGRQPRRQKRLRRPRPLRPAGEHHPRRLRPARPLPFRHPFPRLRLKSLSL